MYAHAYVIMFYSFITCAHVAVCVACVGMGVCVCVFLHSCLAIGFVLRSYFMSVLLLVFTCTCFCILLLCVYMLTCFIALCL